MGPLTKFACKVMASNKIPTEAKLVISKTIVRVVVTLDKWKVKA